jgi:RNA polymerase sigma-70 factor, ECF subfamily
VSGACISPKVRQNTCDIVTQHGSRNIAFLIQAGRFLRPPADALVQESVVRALGKLHLWKMGTDFRAWLFRILNNECVSQIRRAASHGAAVDWSEHQSTLTRAPAQIEQLEIRELVRALTSLAKEQREAVLMISLTQGDYYQVASACNVGRYYPISAVARPQDAARTDGLGSARAAHRRPLHRKSLRQSMRRSSYRPRWRTGAALRRAT